MTVMLKASGKVSRWSAKVSVKAAAEEGRAPQFSIAAYNGGPLHVEGFDLPVVIDLSGLQLPASVPLLAEHRTEIDAVLGQGTPTKSGASVTLDGQIMAATSAAKQVVDMAVAGYQWQASVGCLVLAQERVGSGQKVNVNGQEFSGPIIVARESVLREVSIVPNGADPTTAVSIAAKAAKLKGQAMTFEDWLNSLGLDIATLSEEAKAALMETYTAKQQPSATTPELDATKVTQRTPAETVAAALAEQRKLEAAEFRRVAEIKAKAAKHPLIAAKAIEENWTVEKTELSVLQAERPKAPAGHVPENDAGPAVLQAAVCLQAKLSNIEKKFDTKTLEAADKWSRDGVSLHRLMLEAAWANGYDGRFVTRSNLHEVLRAAMPPMALRAGYTTLSLPGIFSNVANKFLLDGFNHVEQVWRQISAIASVSDFKTITRYRMIDGGLFEEVGPTGVLKMGTLSEESFTNQAKTYGRLYTITRQDLINDDLGALTALPQRIGRQGALKLNVVFWTAFLDNASFFTTGRGNYIEGSTTNLSSAALSQGVAALRKMVDPGGNPVNVKPKFLLTGPTLDPLAAELYSSRQIVMNASGKQPSDNIHYNKYQPLVSDYLEAASISGNSATAWYLLGDPQDVPTIEVVFLDGVETPTVEDADADFDTLGVQMRGFFDFGVSKQDYRGGVKSKGAA